MMITVYLGADHAGFALKNSLREDLETKGFVVEDLGAHEMKSDDDYPQYATAVAQAVRQHPGSFGILSCGNAEGIAMAANKFQGIRAGIGYSVEAAKTMRNDDDANVLAIPGRLPINDDPIEVAEAFLRTPFSKAKRHERRLKQLAELEK